MSIGMETMIMFKILGTLGPNEKECELQYNNGY
jgi:hypothetical protein